MTNARFDQAILEGVTTGTPNARFDQALLEGVTTGTPAARIDQVLVEFVVTMPAAPMIPTAVFPNIAASVGWSVHRRPTNSTRIAGAVSGREVRAPYYAVPLYEFELTYDALLSGSANLGALSAQTLQELQGFFSQMQGQYGGFLFTDPENCQVTGGGLGTGSGTATAFPMLRSVGAYAEQIQVAQAVTAVYLNGVAQAGGSWSVQNGNQIVFGAAPAAGVSVSADFSYYFICRFLDDVHDYEEFMYQIHTLQSCKFRSIRAS